MTDRMCDCVRTCRLGERGKHCARTNFRITREVRDSAWYSLLKNGKNILEL